MQNITLPIIKFPNDIDNNNNLYHVYNHSQSILKTNFDLNTEEIFIEPRNWNDNEIWSFNGGILNIEGELIYYQSVIAENNPNPPSSNFFDNPQITEEEKNLYRRVTGFKNLLRLNSSNYRIHYSGEYIRGYVMAEHHNSLMNSILSIEKFIGINNSTDHTSIDYRLRDLEELIIERDDMNCPYGVFWYEILEENQFSITVQFHITIIGDYESFAFVPENDVTPITDDLNPIYTYTKYKPIGIESTSSQPDNNFDLLIGASLTVNKGDCCACISQSGVQCEPCEFLPIIEDIPTLECPSIETWEVPPICNCPDITCSCEVCTPCITQTCELPSCPECTSINPFTTPIEIIIPDITIPAITTAIDVNINIDWAGPSDEGGEGACFKLVPCGGTTS